MTELTSIDVTDLDIFGNPCDLRRDLHVFVRYVQEREIKRLHRDNNLSKSDSLRLAKMMSDPEAVAGVRETGGSSWVDYVDWMALKMGFVTYDTKGTYAGYTSSSPSFPDNYIQFNAERYHRFVESPLAQQEQLLIDTLVGDRDGGRSEFFQSNILSRLSVFASWGCATGVVPTLDFPKARRFLLNLLQTYQVGVWYSTSSLVRHLKTNHPFFLIPQNPKYKDRQGRDKGRYGNFHESKNYWGYEIDISEHAPDAFERVEGRYVERFLEGIPLTLSYVDVAYDSQPHTGIYPSLDTLKAFRVNNRLLHALAGDIPSPRVTVQPNFEIIVESEFYPAYVLSQLIPLADVISEDVSTILKLRKEKVAARLAQDEGLDIAALLTRLTGRDLPANVARELAEWAEHSEKLTLYEGFALLEGDQDLATTIPFIAEATVKRISPAICIVRSPETVYARLEEAELIPLSVQHSESRLHPLPEKARTVFAKTAPMIEPEPQKESVVLMRHATITLHFPTEEWLERFRQALLDVRCPVEVDQSDRTITFAKRYEPQVTKLIETLRKEKEYEISIEDIQ